MWNAAIDFAFKLNLPDAFENEMESVKKTTYLKSQIFFVFKENELN